MNRSCVRAVSHHLQRQYVTKISKHNMTVLDVCFEQQWRASFLLKHGILKGRRVGVFPSSNENTLKTVQHLTFTIPKENFFFKHPPVAATLSTPTQRSYLSSFRKFKRSIQHQPRSPHELDEELHTYINEAYHQDTSQGNRQRMCNLISFLSLECPHARKDFGLSRRSISGWNKLKPPQSALPLTKPIMLAFARYFQQKGSLSAAVALVLQWSTYMQGSEVLNLKKTDVALPGDPHLHHSTDFGGVNIEQSKTGPVQFTTIRDCAVLDILNAFLCREANHSRSKLFNLTYGTYNSLFKDAAIYFGFDQTRFSSHSGRIGGATTDYCRGVSAKTIALTGRWKSFTSLERYLQNGRSWLLRIQS